jgi:curved DNA-binding protein CbpA
MGAAQSRIEPRHIGIYKKLLAIQNHTTRLHTIDTLLQDAGIVNSAKVAGIYGAILQYSGAVRHGQNPPLLPFEQSVSQAPTQQTHMAVVHHGQPQEELASRFVSNQRSYHPQQFQQRVVSNQLVAVGQVQHQDYYQQVSKPRQSEKALNFFTACLRVLGIQEEISLTEETLKSAYKKAARAAHPDKGGSKEAFDAVTRAFAYLMDIIKLVKGASGSAGQETVPTLDTANQRRREAAESWKMPEEPVKLNPKNLDMNKFNQLFEQTRVPDPDEDGYGDWLKDEADKKGKKLKNAKNFSDNFNREVFNRMFEEEQAAEGRGGGAIIQFNHPQELTLSAHAGVELGRDRPPDYTAAYDSKMQFTDLMSAYTKENTVSEKVSNVKVENRDFNSYKAQREKAPERYNEAEMSALAAYEAQQKRREQQRQVRAAQEQVAAQDYFARMKQLVITEK